MFHVFSGSSFQSQAEKDWATYRKQQEELAEERREKERKLQEDIKRSDKISLIEMQDVSKLNMYRKKLVHS